MVTKQSPLVEEAKEIIDRLYADCRTTVMSTEELETLIEELTAGHFTRPKG